MSRAVFMTKDQIAGLVEIARRDEKLWSDLKDRELNRLDENGVAKLPSLSMLVDEFAAKELGPNHNFDIGSLIIRLRYHTRIELGLPVSDSDPGGILT